MGVCGVCEGVSVGCVECVRVCSVGCVECVRVCGWQCMECVCWSVNQIPGIHSQMRVILRGRTIVSCWLVVSSNIDVIW